MNFKKIIEISIVRYYLISMVYKDKKLLINLTKYNDHEYVYLINLYWETALEFSFSFFIFIKNLLENHKLKMSNFLKQELNLIQIYTNI